MAQAEQKTHLSAAISARLMRMKLFCLGIAIDFWRDAPFPWPKWARPIKDMLGPKPKKPRPAPKASAAPKSQMAEAPVAATEGAGEEEQREPSIWTADRVQVMETLWGEGQNLPGGNAYVEKLVNPLGINNNMSILDLGAGLGALARYIAEEHGAYVTGMEQSATLASRGMVMSIAAGKSKQASVISYDPGSFTASRKYDCIFAREVFYRVIGKEKFFNAVHASLKSGGGQLVFTDLILDPKFQEKPAITRWLAKERVASPLSMLETIKQWKGFGYDMRVAEDQTEVYKGFILDGLMNFAEHLKMNIPDDDTKPVIAYELDLWTRRMAAFKEGLKYCRFYAIKY